ncbi:MAG: sulfate ABC transporter permease subunit CysW, partial [Treponemataceae bacterium]|nr:sulfate ABC transporter permease subunit CysW [Treponemataceae bacterium]
MKNKKINPYIKWTLIAVTVFFLFVMLILPLISVVINSLYKGWKFYYKTISDPYTVKAFLLTIRATGWALLINTIFGLFAAWTITKYHFRGKKVLTTLIDLPVTVSPIIAGLIFILIFGRQSPIYPILMKMHFKVVFAVPG